MDGKLVRAELVNVLAGRYAHPDPEEVLAVTLPGVPDIPRLNAILVQAAHQSWHLGQIVLIRRILEAEDQPRPR